MIPRNVIKNFFYIWLPSNLSCIKFIRLKLMPLFLKANRICYGGIELRVKIVKGNITIVLGRTEGGTSK
jgi:hypothetical protein